MPKAVKEETKQEPKTAPVRGNWIKYWAPQHSRYSVALGDRLVEFENNTLVLHSTGDAEVVARLEGSPAYRQAFFRVENGENDMDYQEKFMAYLGKLIPNDPADQVSTVQGIGSLMSLFNEKELAEIEVSWSNVTQRKDRLILAAIRTKKVEGLL